MTNAAAQARFKQRIPQKGLRRLDAVIPFSDFMYLKQLAEQWECSRVDALSRVIRQAWVNEGYALDKGDELPGKVMT